MSNTYPVNEMFQTIQGEASFTGTPSFFIRLQGCPVGCAWCDTKHTWEVKPSNVVPIKSLLYKVAEADTFSQMTVEEIMLCLDNQYAQHVVITGGEPCMHDLMPLTEAIIDAGYSCQIETSGTFPIHCDPDCFVTLSPKIDMPGGMTVLDESYMRADEFKFPIGKEADVDKLFDNVVFNTDKMQLLYLQPLSQSPKATQLCIDVATLNNWRISIQTHKYLNLR